jgi:hypothetical protein
VSLLTTDPKQETFLDRFEQLRATLRRFQVRQGLGWTALAAALGLLALTAADYWFELPRPVRAAGLVAATAAALAVLVTRVVVPLRWWTKPRTAAEIERRFPGLGQRVRTVVQYGGLSEEMVRLEGVTPSLVDALEAETEIRVEPLKLDAVVPRRRVWAAAALAALPALALAIAVAPDGEWRTALARALLFERAYTALTVLPGNVTIDQGETVRLDVEMKGRPERDVVLLTRPDGLPDAPWTSAPLQVKNGSKREGRLEKVKRELAYRVTAGSATSPTYVVRVRYPLAIRSFEVALEPPSYTGIKPETVKGGDLHAVVGTLATFRIAFDAPPAEASLVLNDPSAPAKGKDEPPKPRVIRLRDGGSAFTAELNLTKGWVYRIEAKTADGRVLPKNRYRIDVRDDRAPRVSFDEPDEAMEVHPVAEVRNRVRAGDDFGLTKAGIVFRFNDGEERTLVAHDFTTPADTGKRTTSATLDETLLLETLAASPTDSVTYYAFAEDNDPAGPKRTETDLRYIDIRPFKREYKKGEAGDEAGGQSTSLNELIARQRFNLNRANRLTRRKPADKGPAEDPFKIAGFEETLAGLTREFTEGIEGIAGERVEPLHQAEEAMLAAVEALDHGRNGDSPKPMAEALRHLISARRTIQIIIAEGGSAAERVRQFDRTQAQKIRKDKNKNDEAEEIADRLEELAKEEDFVYATLSASSEPGDQPGGSGETEKGEDAEKASSPSKGSQGKGKSGSQGEKRDDGAAPKSDPRETSAKQEKIVDELRTIEEKLKRLEEASALAKARMAKAAEEAEKASNALARGNTKEATGSAKAGAAMLHELARQVKGEIAREVADELAMARDLAAELAEREAELGRMPDAPAVGQEGSTGDGGTGREGRGETDRLERLREAARTLEEWLRGASLRAEGDAAARLRGVVEENPVARVVERMDRVGVMVVEGRRPEARDEAKEASRLLEVLARRLDVLHREIVAPEVATLVELENRVAGLMDELKTLRTDAEITAWHVKAAALVRDLERAGLSERAAELTGAMEAGGWRDDAGAWAWGVDPAGLRLVPAGYAVALRRVAVAIQDRVQDLILKDLASARDEATPPEFRELVERYYEVLSSGVGNK